MWITRNQQRDKEMDTVEAPDPTGKHRLRPILMTALTTIIALSTTVFDTSAGGELMRPMAVTTIGGLLYSTLLTLFLVPALYKMFHRKNKTVAQKNRKPRNWTVRQFIVKDGEHVKREEILDAVIAF